MSLVIVTTSKTNTEQFIKFLKHIDKSIADYNTALASASDKAGQNPIDQAAFISKARELLQANDLNGLVEHILTLGDFLIQEPKVAVSSFVILTLIVTKIDKKDGQLRGIKALNEYILSRAESQHSLKFRLFQAVFNTINGGELKFVVFSRILELAEAVKKPNIVLHHLTNLDEFVVSWSLNKEQEINLYRKALSLINMTDDKYYREKHQVYTKFLTALNAKFDVQVFNQNKKDIENIILTILITFPDHVDFNNLLELKSITEVKNSNAVLYELFELALNGSYQDFIPWNQKNSAFLKANGIDEHKIIDRVRLRSFFKLALNKKTIKIKEVQDNLNLDELEAEFWIIKALQSGRVEGKIDQLEGVFHINGINDASFKSGDWKELGDRLESFRKQFEGLIENIRKDK